MNISTIGTLYTIGYAHPDAARSLAHLMGNPHTMLLDIRYAPRSRWHPAWNRPALEQAYGARYLWEQRLGNVNYRDREQGIALAEGHQEAVRAVAELVRSGRNLILLCACKDPRTCHRTLVAKLIQDALDADHQEGAP
jgi:uncharacterized protein (DUF488 family)